MFSFDRFRFRKPVTAKTHYARNGSGVLLPLLAGLAYRYREPILRWVREKLEALKARRDLNAGSTLGGTPPPMPASQPF